MINILPPELREQIAYSKRNVLLRRYALLTLVIGALLGATFYGSQWYADRQIAAYQVALAEKQAESSERSQAETDVQELKKQVDLIEKLFEQQTKFSLLLGDLAAVLPANSYINSITLTGDDKQPVQLLLTTNSFDNAGVIRNALIESPRISLADIQSVTANKETTGYTVSIVIAFSEGGAR